MIKYKISGTLPAPWEDFIPVQEGFPHVTIASGCKKASESTDEDGWVDIDITEPSVTKKRAIDILSKLVGEVVEIKELGISQAHEVRS